MKRIKRLSIFNQDLRCTDAIDVSVARPVLIRRCADSLREDEDVGDDDNEAGDDDETRLRKRVKVDTLRYKACFSFILSSIRSDYIAVGVKVKDEVRAAAPGLSATSTEVLTGLLES